MQLTPVTEFDGWCAKREDLACLTDIENYPSGSKVRQYMGMAERFKGVPMLVGCSANSAQQIYIAAASKLSNVRGIVFVPKRKIRTSATDYALSLGVELHEEKPAYLSVIRKRTRDFSKTLNSFVHWNPKLAVEDTIFQCQNIPDIVKRVVVPCGSGLNAIGILAGLSERVVKPDVVLINVSTMCNLDKVITKAKLLTDKRLPNVSVIRVPVPYDTWRTAKLPDGMPLDPFYAAKALPYIKDGDCLWVSGLRPLKSMPIDCVRELQTLGATV